MGTITHQFVSALPDDPDTTLVRPSNWNDTHTFTLTGPDVGLPVGGDITGNPNGVAIGLGSIATGAYAMATGEAATATGDFSFAYGYSANASGIASCAFGAYSAATHNNSVAIGDLSETGRTGEVSIGKTGSTRLLANVTAGLLGTDAVNLDQLNLKSGLASTNTFTAQNTFAAGTITTSQPFTISQTWNAGAVTFNSLFLNITSTASAAASKALDIHVGGSTKFSVNKGGGILIGGTTYGMSEFGVTTIAGLIFSAGIEIKTGGETKWSSTAAVGFSSTTNVLLTADTAWGRAAPNSLVYSATGVAGSATSRTQIQREGTGIADATATTVLTITVPNAAHSAIIMVTLNGRLGAGGAIGADEASGTVSYLISITRTAGVNAVANISAAFGSTTSAVAGATTITVAGTLGAVVGAVGAVNTIPIQITITKGGGASANHKCTSAAKLLNSNSTGITIA